MFKTILLLQLLFPCRCKCLLVVKQILSAFHWNITADLQFPCPPGFLLPLPYQRRFEDFYLFSPGLEKVHMWHFCWGLSRESGSFPNGCSLWSDSERGSNISGLCGVALPVWVQTSLASATVEIESKATYLRKLQHVAFSRRAVVTLSTSHIHTTSRQRRMTRCLSRFNWTIDCK